MAFLELNGLTIPVRDTSAREEFVDVGMRARAFDGTLLTSRRARKRMWRGRTHPLVELDAKTVEGVVAGLGDTWPFNYSDSARLTKDLFSAKGAGVINSGIGTLGFGTAADGDLIYAVGTSNLTGKFGNSYLAPHGPVTNLLTANQRDVEDGTTGFTLIGTATLAVNTANRVQGSQSLAVTINAANDGVDVDAVSASATTAYVGSFYIKSFDAAAAVRVRLIGDVSGTITTITPTINNGRWDRVIITGTTGGSDTTIKIEIVDTVPNHAGFYIDAIQLEQSAFANPWIDGTSAASDLEYSPTIVSEFEDYTINLWAWSPSAALAASAALYNLTGSDADGNTVTSRLFRGTAANNIAWFTVNGATSDTLVYSTTPWDDTWHMITLVARKNPETGEVGKRIYFDGTSVATTSASTSLGDTSSLDSFFVGILPANTAPFTESRIDDFTLLPWAASQAQVTAWFNMGVAMPALPAVRLTGDVVPETSVLVDGRVSSSQFVGAVVNGSYRTNAREVDFVLEEI